MSCKLQQYDADLIRVFSEFGFTKRALAGEYDVHIDTVRNILNNRSFTGGKSGGGKVNLANRKLNDDQVRFIHAQAALGHKEQKIASLLGNVVSKSTVRQVIEGRSYAEVT